LRDGQHAFLFDKIMNDLGAPELKTTTLNRATLPKRLRGPSGAKMSSNLRSGRLRGLVMF
jgi:hypothetical protein